MCLPTHLVLSLCAKLHVATCVCARVCVCERACVCVCVCTQVPGVHALATPDDCMEAEELVKADPQVCVCVCVCVCTRRSILDPAAVFVRGCALAQCTLFSPAQQIRICVSVFVHRFKRYCEICTASQISHC